MSYDFLSIILQIILWNFDCISVIDLTGSSLQFGLVDLISLYESCICHKIIKNGFFWWEIYELFL